MSHPQAEQILLIAAKYLFGGENCQARKCIWFPAKISLSAAGYDYLGNAAGTFVFTSVIRLKTR